MSKTLTDFLTPVENVEETIDLGSRFPEPFHIRAISKATYDGILRRVKGKDGEINAQELELEMILAGTVSPDFADAQLCGRCGTLDPKEAIGKVLLAGECVILSKKIFELSGFDQKRLEVEAKN